MNPEIIDNINKPAFTTKVNGLRLSMLCITRWESFERLLLFGATHQVYVTV